jgi:hypothetical protein
METPPVTTSENKKKISKKATAKTRLTINGLVK